MLKSDNPWGARVVRTEKCRGGTFELLSDGLIICSPSTENVGLLEAKEMTALIDSLKPTGKATRLLLDQRTVRRSISAEGKKYMAEHSDAREKVAILVANAVSRFFASSIIAMDGGGSGNRMKVFDDVARALAWLREPT